MGTSDRAAFRAIGALVLAAAVVLMFAPITASSSDAAHACGALLRRVTEPMRRGFCEERGAFRTREQWVGGTALTGAMLVAVGRRRVES